ncbi:unnamed protein product [Tilletia laevis]|uniref:CWH43-like N-terminal domain-containing protein n=4 Tax=Tilletia TaxID=13289 RepID=A0A8X7MPJ4_9BASI|nr:hypothetical protein A4X06_0g6284 [Tilletia controversa]CAD6943129.1 unnamed protein product [Tilletia laevis]CAD6949194.1 unnamed protein product [Tilletia caries]CAD6925842.1 unnamed protein product [Tilletia controversa]CAD6945674.1 unnamed protein product [Tilletia laevis]
MMINLRRDCCWLAPLFTAGCWLSNIIGLLLFWTIREEKREYKSNLSSILFISDIGGIHRTYFIILSSCTAGFYILTTILRHFRSQHWSSRHSGTAKERQIWWLSIASSFSAFVAAMSLVLLSVFDTFRHERIHVSFLILFVVGVSLSVLLQIIPVLYLTKDHDGEQLHPRRVAYVKLYLLVLAVPVVVLFMITYAICHGTVPEGDARCDRVVSTAAVCDWAVAFILAVFFIAYTFDFLKSSAGKLNGHRLDETGSPSAQIAGLHHLDEEDSVAMEEARRQV